MTGPVTIVLRVTRPGERATALLEDLAVRLRRGDVTPGARGYVRITYDDKTRVEAWDCVRAALDELADDWAGYLRLSGRSES
jgi:hypothetical protein